MSDERGLAAIGETGPLVLFDGVCNLCSWSVQFLAPRDRDRALWYAAVQSPFGQRVLERYGLPTGDYDSFVFLENGQVHLKSAAFLRVVRYMREPWPILRIGQVLPRLWADWMYDRVARNRYAVFGKKSVCMVPRADMMGRFIG
jgi:predicted DCC family thiol-disulfide oxidoreductase YuxK